MLASALPRRSDSSGTHIYRPRQPARSVLHKTVRHHLETWLAARSDDLQGPVPGYVRTVFRSYLKCGILAHGFARVHCFDCGHEFLLAFSCKGRDICPSCASRRMAEVAAHLIDEVLPRVPYRQWVLSVPKRVRWHMRTKPEVTSGLLRVFLRAVETTLRQRSPGAPRTARFGAVAFVHRFGSFLNSHVHYHVVVTDGVFSAAGEDAAVFHPALDLTLEDVAGVQRRMRSRGLRYLGRHGHLDSSAIDSLSAADHAGGWSVDASVRIADWDRQGLERLVRYCARPPFSGEHLERLNDQTLVYHLRKPLPDGRTELVLSPLELLDRIAALVSPPRLHKHRYCGVLAPHARLRRAVVASSGPAGATVQLLEEACAQMGLQEAAREPVGDSSSSEASAAGPLPACRRALSRSWAFLLARIYECLPLLCPRCRAPMRIVSFVQDQGVIERILRHVGEPVEAPAVMPARAPPQAKLEFDQTADLAEWPDEDQTADRPDDEWE